MDAARRALNRFGLGARTGERRRIGDARRWLLEQLDGGAPALPAADTPPAGEIGDAVRALRMLGPGNERQRREARRRLVDVAARESRVALASRVTTDRPFVERLVAFWSNHLCVSAGSKILVAPFAGSYEREVIRPHVLGRFDAMVLASARHPAMLLYLDNFQSIGPSSAGARSGRQRGTGRGLNENYARELLELHTLGVSGGYTEQDVQELARILTGWTIDGVGGPAARTQRQNDPTRPGAARGGRGVIRSAPEPGSPVRFAFQPLLHEPGTKSLLGQRYGDDGAAEGERAIRALCHHPSTATFIATKLVAHFVSDDPPAAAVDRVARAFRSSDGNLRVVAEALVEEPDAWRDDTRKFRTPQDWLIAVLRALGMRDVDPRVPTILRQLRQPLWSPPSPKGFGDGTSEWADPDSLLNRAELARTIARMPALSSLDPGALVDAADVPAVDPLRALAADTSISHEERVALVIAGPAFQWR